MDSYGLDTHFFTGADNAQCDFAAVGDEYFIEQGRLAWANFQKWLVVFDWLSIIDEELDDFAADLGRDLIHNLHCFDDTDGLSVIDCTAFADEGGCFG